MPAARRSDTGPFALVPEWVLDAPISDGALRQYAILARYADREGAAFPSRRALAERQGCSDQTVDRRNRELVFVGALTVEARYDAAGDRTSNLYHITRVCPGGLADEATLPPIDEGTGAPTDGAVNENHAEREPVNDIDADASPAPAREKPARERSEKQRARDRLFDAVVVAFGPATTDSRAAFYGKAVSQLVKVEATPEQVIQARAEITRRGWSDPSPEAMLKHWDDLLRHAASTSTGSAPSQWDRQTDAALADRERRT